MELSYNILFIIPLQLIAILSFFPIARKYKLFDIPNHRSSHKNITYRGGGIILPISIIFYIIFFGFNHGLSKFYFLMGVLLASVVSLYDDINGSNPFFRLIIHFVSLGLILMDIKEDNQFLPIIIIIIAIIGVAAVNAFNFMDGINGMLGLYAFVFFETILFVNYKIENNFDPNLIIVISIALLIFMFFNFRTKAIFFAGDVGSVSLGLLCVFYVLYLILHTNNIIYLSMLTVFGVESGLTIFYRLTKRQNIFQAHRMHLFQNLVNTCKMSHLLVSFLYTLVQIIINIGMFYCIKKNYDGYLYLIYVLIVLIGTYIIIKYQTFKRTEELNEKN
ncbi:MAG: UDP-GlcNAc--UDP-phosphate GlcNAc-1-phosphate transferase [Bacteroidia bacterium]|nr:UDP-GlcNAc--UDP-phosphate GlcNAc-1-phosphate transferase [Bacteroidia bacterium]